VLPVKKKMSLCRQNYTPACENAVNQQINAELTASYIYLSMAAHFDRDEISLPGFAKFFQKNSDEEREHAQKFIKYQTTRGGRVVFEDIPKPMKTPETPLSALEATLALEKTINTKLLALSKLASESDPHLTDFLDSFLEEQVEAERHLADLIINCKRAGDGLGLYIFDKDIK